VRELTRRRQVEEAKQRLARDELDKRYAERGEAIRRLEAKLGDQRAHLAANNRTILALNEERT
jgi:hypothetical protein